MEQTWLTCEILQARLEVRTIPTWEPMCVNGQHNSHLDIYSLGRSYDHNRDVGMGFPSIETPQAKPAKLEPREVSTFDVETMARKCSTPPSTLSPFHFALSSTSRSPRHRPSISSHQFLLGPLMVASSQIIQEIEKTIVNATLKAATRFLRRRTLDASRHQACCDDEQKNSSNGIALLR
jgi:hypothetical protein